MKKKIKHTVKGINITNFFNKKFVNWLKELPIINIGDKWKKIIELIIIILSDKLKLKLMSTLFKFGVTPAAKKFTSKIKI